MRSGIWRPVTLMSVGQTVAWASTFYLPAALGTFIVRDTGISSFAFFAMVTAALLASAILGPPIGRLVDRHGGRLVLAVSTLANALGLILLSQADSAADVVGAWACIALGMAFGLYEVAAATLVAMTTKEARRAISFYTLFSGLSSSVSWLVTAWSLDAVGWRTTCLYWAVAQIAIALPAYLLLPQEQPLAKRVMADEPASTDAHKFDNGLMHITALAFCAGAIVVAGLAAHLPRLIELAGYSHVDALAIASLVGPAQIVARLLDAVTVSRSSPIVLAAGASLLHPTGAILMLLALPFGQILFPLMHGITSGITTTARATIPLTVFGPLGFGERFGRLSRAVRIVSALGPLVFSVLIERLGVLTLAVSSSLCVISALMFAALASRAARRGVDFSATRV